MGGQNMNSEAVSIDVGSLGAVGAKAQATPEATPRTLVSSRVVAREAAAAAIVVAGLAALLSPRSRGERRAANPATTMAAAAASRATTRDDTNVRGVASGVACAFAPTAPREPTSMLTASEFMFWPPILVVSQWKMRASRRAPSNHRYERHRGSFFSASHYPVTPPSLVCNEPSSRIRSGFTPDDRKWFEETPPRKKHRTKLRRSASCAGRRSFVGS